MVTKVRWHALPGGEERQARLEKMAELKRLRSYELLLDPNAQFHDIVDCAALFEVSERGWTFELRADA